MSGVGGRDAWTCLWRRSGVLGPSGVSVHNFSSIEKIEIAIVPRPQQTLKPPTEDRPSSFIPPPSSLRCRGGRFLFATPRNTYSQGPIRWAVQPPPTIERWSNAECRPLTPSFRRYAVTECSPYASFRSSFSDTPPVELAPPPDDTDNVDGASLSDEEEPLLTQPPESAPILPPPPITIRQNFDKDNAAYTPPLETKCPPPPRDAVDAVAKMMFGDVWGIDPRPYQVSAPNDDKTKNLDPFSR